MEIKVSLRNPGSKNKTIKDLEGDKSGKRA
jgi:hypothetical protein